MQLDAGALAAATAEIVKTHVSAATAPLLKRIEALEKQPAPERGEPGADGRGIDRGEVRDGVLILRLTDGTEQEAGNIVGPKGEDGKDADPEAIAESFRPIAENIVSEAVAAGIAKLPPPEKGEKGDQGQPGADGADGRGVADLLVDRDGNLVATFDDGRMKSLGFVQGKDGEPGKDGRDGFSLEGFDCEAIDERTVKLLFQRGDVAHSYELTFPVPIYRGVFKDGTDYERGDMTTWAGSLWHCDEATKAKPGEGPWTLATKKGRDGKSAA